MDNRYINSAYTYISSHSKLWISSSFKRKYQLLAKVPENKGDITQHVYKVYNYCFVKCKTNCLLGMNTHVESPLDFNVIVVRDSRL